MPSRESRLLACRIPWNPIASWLPGKRHQLTLGTSPAGHSSQGRRFPVSASSPEKTARSSQPSRSAGQRAVIQALRLVGCIAVPDRRGQTVGPAVCLCIATQVENSLICRGQGWSAPSMLSLDPTAALVLGGLLIWMSGRGGSLLLSDLEPRSRSSSRWHGMDTDAVLMPGPRLLLPSGWGSSGEREAARRPADQGGLVLDLGAGHRIDPEPAEQRRGVQRGGLRPQQPARRRACLPGTVRRDDRSIQRATPMILRAVAQVHGRAARTA